MVKGNTMEVPILRTPEQEAANLAYYNDLWADETSLKKLAIAAKNDSVSRRRLRNFLAYAGVESTSNADVAAFFTALANPATGATAEQILSALHNSQSIIDKQIVERTGTKVYSTDQTGLVFFWKNSKASDGIRTADGNKNPFTFLPKELTLKVATFTPSTADGPLKDKKLHEVDETTRETFLRSADYVLISQAAVKNSLITLKIGNKIYLNKVPLSNIGDNHYHDRKLGMIEIQKQIVAFEGETIEVKVENLNVKFADNLAFELVISGTGEDK